MTVVAPIDRLAAILRLDMPAAVSPSTSRMLRMGNLAPGIAPAPCGKGRDQKDSRITHRRPSRFLPAIHSLLGIARNRCSGSVGTTARDQSERRLLGINRNCCSRSLGAPKPSQLLT